MKRVFGFLLLVTLSHAQNVVGLQPRHAQVQLVTNECQKEVNVTLVGTVRKGDQIPVRVRWPTDCGINCQFIGTIVDTQFNEYYPDKSWGHDNDVWGLKCGPEFCEQRQQTDAAGAKETGSLTLHLPLYCPAGSWYGINIESQNGTF